MSPAASTSGEGTRARPTILDRTDAARIITVDVRDELRAGREPFSIIMAARRELPEDGVLCVRAIFEPVPLYAVMLRQGLVHWTEQRADDDWVVWFYPEQSAEPGPGPTSAEHSEPAARPGAGDTAANVPADDVVVLDVRGLEPPEPMVRTLAALEQLPAGATLVQINARVPQFLLPMLDERGFTYDIREQDNDVVRLFIHHRKDAT
jgi:uncharacterized protein (DUF2249 family)